ncbi:hypothetical protein [Roseibium salinum]|uniref:Uncharacterized protein n=1 Tax=Roseibium salinum TaxID=1604349 RepID=A0ABT3R5K7_9HYPH|nr:hypothetical protein [Roseibium sp. DSM 29163]MCX2724340.1 hypothetical protein [Roseibium sp. DSM 29163]
MSLSAIFASRYQRRTFLLLSILIIAFALATLWAIYYFLPDIRAWNLIISLLISVVASAVFALVSALFISYFFEDPTAAESKAVLLPQDIGPTLQNMANNAHDYKIYVRTGRHFRSEILPLIAKAARRERRPVNIEVILLDFRDNAICEKYANYRRSASFDSKLWSRKYVQKEVLSTIIALIQTANENTTFINIELYLSSRLSTFRIEGSSQEILVTREDPKDIAARYLSSHRNHAAFVTEFTWIRDAALSTNMGRRHSLPATLEDLFKDTPTPIIAELKDDAVKALESPSPYAR